ncbi:retrovirus-related pol polyprotein from transposon TNT 1-94 [Tanacetum coccineum]|uniref:Retrovirus-related pol polyprotein from transposon TNT 1-94 n=1 Tax=Tanacetum coccineum TaxID=301880 RepID=A0ABQ5CJ33_9ASTR
MVDNTLFTKKKSSNLIIVQIYVNDIIFGLTCQDMCDEFAKIMHDDFEMSMMGELNFFFGLQIKQIEDGIFFNQSKYIKEMLRKFSLEESKPMKTPISSDTKLTKDEECESVDSTEYRCMIGCCLTSWFSKKQTALAISTTEAEYVSAGKACQQALWMKQALIDYDVQLDDVPIMYNNKGAIDLSKNPVQHFRTKHIKIRYHFLRDNVQKGHISIEKVPSVDNIADILTKPLKRESFNYLRACVFTDRWRLDELAYGIPSDGPYQTNPPSIEDIISSIRIDREGQVRRIRHEEEIDVLEYQILTCEIVSTLKPLEEIIRENIFCLGEQKPRRDHGTRRGRPSTSSSTFDQLSLSHLHDDDDDGNDKGTSCASTPSPIRYVNSLTNQVLQVFQNPPNIDSHLEPFYTRQTEFINRQVQLRDEQRGGVRVDPGAPASGPLLTGSSLLAALFKAREDDERYQESR